MSKSRDLSRARRWLSPKEFEEYKEWLNKPWVERYPYLATLLFQVSLFLNAVFLLLTLVLILEVRAE